MRTDNVQDAIDEANRFIERALDWQQNKPRFDFSPSKEGGALRRSSMDLTRALAALRKPS